jgi:hypothetical protein
VDTSTVQSRVTGTCAAGSSIASIAGNGTVTCEVDDDAGGDVTGVTAGAGLTGGGTAGAVSLAVDTAAIQARVASSCPAGSSIASITAAGGVTCETDDVGSGDITDVTAGAGLTGGGTSGSVSLAVNTAVIQSRVTSSCSPGFSINGITAAGGVTCEEDTTGASVTVIATSATITAGNYTTLQVSCPAAYPICVGGGIDLSNVFYMVVTSSGPLINGARAELAGPDGQFGTSNGWFGAARDDVGSPTSGSFRVIAICTK